MKLIIAKYREDVSWANLYPDKFIVTKGIHIPNFGREPASFIWYIIQNYNDLSGQYAFLQGNPYDHIKNLDVQLAQVYGPGFHWLIGQKFGGWLTCDGNARPHDHLPLAEVYEHLFKEKFPGTISFMNGGQFIVDAETIKKRPLDFYKECFKMLERPDKTAWCFERMWEKLFS